MLQCTRCEKQFSEYDQLRKHVGRVHKITSSLFFVEFHLDGKHPTCVCGCGESVKWRAGSFQKYINGHNARGDTNPIHTLTEEQWAQRKAKHSATNKAQFAAGTRKMWSEGRRIETDLVLQRAAKKISNNVERSQKISNALKGKSKTKEHMAKVHAAQREWLRKGQLDKPSQPELQMERILQELKMLYECQVSVKYYLFDFKLTAKNVLIEVDGDFFHCHPSKFPEPMYETQRATLRNDKRKAAVAQKEGFILLRFWESDINNNSELVKQQLMNYI
jgi:very-short-patch-repair endonuclease